MKKRGISEAVEKNVGIEQIERRIREEMDVTRVLEAKMEVLVGDERNEWCGR